MKMMIIYLLAGLTLPVENATTGQPVDSAYAIVYGIYPDGRAMVIDSGVVRNGKLVFDVTDTTIKNIGIQIKYNGYDFFSPVLTLPLKGDEKLLVYNVTNKADDISIVGYDAFVVDQDTLIVVSENIYLAKQGKEASIPENPIIKVVLPEGFTGFRYTGLPTDTVEIVGDTLFIRPFVVPNANNIVGFVYAVSKKLKMHRDFGPIQYSLAVPKRLKHKVTGLTPQGEQPMGNITLIMYGGNSPFTLEASTGGGSGLSDLLSKYKYVLVALVAILFILALMYLQKKQKGTSESQEKKEE